MQVTKIRIADQNGLVPAGAYFSRLADNLRAANARDAAALEKAETRERKLEARYRRTRGAAATRSVYEQHAAI